jgi:hypothetical protein
MSFPARCGAGTRDQLRPGVRLLALIAADGSTLMLSDSTADVITIAREHELQTVSTH